MSNTIRIYKTIKEGYPHAQDLDVVAIVGGKYGKSVQISIGTGFAVLSEKQILDLISVLANRILSRKGFTAVEFGTPKTILPNGEIKEEVF